MNEYQNINLFDFIRLLWHKFVGLLRWLLSAILFLIRLMLRRWYVMLACLLLGFGLAYVWCMPRFSRYTGRATILFADGMKPLVEEGLYSFISESYETRHDVYHIPDSILLAQRKFAMYNSVDAKSDSTIDFIDYKSKVPSEDTLSSIARDRLTIEFQLQGQYDFRSIESALLYYFCSREEFARPAKLYQAQLQERLEWLDHEIARTDSLINREQQSLNLADGLTLRTSADPSYRDILKLMREKQYIQAQLELTPSVITFQTHFYCFTMERKDKYLIGLCFGLALGIIISLIIKYWANIMSFLKQS